MSISPSSATLAQNGGVTVNVTLSNLTGSNTITASPSNSGQIQVSPTTRSLTTSGTVSFNVTVKKQNGSVTFSSSPNCGSATVTLTVELEDEGQANNEPTAWENKYEHGNFEEAG